MVEITLWMWVAIGVAGALLLCGCIYCITYGNVWLLCCNCCGLCGRRRRKRRRRQNRGGGGGGVDEHRLIIEIDDRRPTHDHDDDSDYASPSPEPAPAPGPAPAPDPDKPDPSVFPIPNLYDLDPMRLFRKPEEDESEWD